MSGFERNVILVTAPSGGGKSHYIRNLTGMFLASGISYAHITDADHIAQAVVRDHEHYKGRNHIHPPQMSEIYYFNDTGHEHLNEKSYAENVFPFAVTSNAIRDEMFRTYWEAVLNAPSDGFVVAELAAGRNIHPSEHLHGKADYSYESMALGFEQRKYPPEVLQRILVAIHPETSYEVRLDRTIRERDDSWKEVVDIFGEDDFPHLRQLLESQGATTISIANDRDKTAEEIQRELFAGLERYVSFHKEGQRSLQERK